MRRIQWRKFIGHIRLKQTLGAAFNNNALGHAYLFSGDFGSGTFAAALELAAALLCDGEGDVPCYQCESCRQLEHHAHPDFHITMPVPLQKKHKGSDGKLSDEGWKYVSNYCRYRMENPYTLADDFPENFPFDKSDEKTAVSSGIPAIPVEWIRETNHAILRGAVRGKRNVAVFIDVDMMKKESANAILKTLEEPPAETVIILITERIHAVLPTILSRCQIMRFGYLSPEDIRRGIKERYADLTEESIDNVVRCAGGSLSAALGLIERPLDLRLKDAGTLWGLCTKKDKLAFASELDDFISESLDGGKDHQACERILTYVIYLIRDIYLSKIPGTQKYIRTNPSHTEVVPQRPQVVERMVSVCQDAIYSVRSRGNVALTLTNFALTMMEIINGQEQ